MSNTVAAVDRLLTDPTAVQDVILRDVPILASHWGAKDEDALLHTLGINLFTSLGRAAGFCWAY